MAAQVLNVQQCVYVKTIQKHVRVLEQDIIAIIQEKKQKRDIGVVELGNVRLNPNVLYKEIKEE